MSLIDRDALAQAIYERAGGDAIPDFTQEDCKQLADAAIAYLRTVITAWNLAETHPYGRSMDSIDFLKPYVRAIFGDTEE